MAEPKYKQYILDFRLSDGTTHSIPLKVPFGEPGKDGITPHIGSNGNWFIGEKDTGISAGGSGGYVAQDDPPEDTSVLWIDTDDNSDDGFQAAVNTALAQAKASGEFDGPKGDPGDDYVLTDDDRNEIAELAAGLVEVPDAPSGGENALYVTVTKSADGVTTADKTFDEIRSAFTENRAVFCVYTDHTPIGSFVLQTTKHVILPLCACNETVCAFYHSVIMSIDGESVTIQGNVFFIGTSVTADIVIAEYATKDDIPDGGISVTGAKVGQTVKIASVDENGVPTAWEPTDFPSGGGSGGGKYELIAKGTIAEAFQGFAIDKDMDGKTYKLSSCYAEIVAEPIEGGDIYAQCKINGKITATSLQAKPEQKRYYQYKCDFLGATVLVSQSVNGNPYNNGWEYANHTPSYTNFQDKDAIVKFEFTGNGGANSKYQLWGVRA